jgi:aspartyl-tRNA(Asn)/glutamyl-tRNA(Gln) amidotransferase subunit A
MCPGCANGPTSTALTFGRNWSVDYIDVHQARRVVTRQILDRLAGVDVAIGPTVPLAAPPIETTSATGDHDADPRPALLRLTRVFDVTGQPAVSVPCGFTDEGLPIELQIVSQPWHEALALQVAHAYQQVTDWPQTTPADQLMLRCHRWGRWAGNRE